ncbi:protein kinase dsk1 [Parachaetomium inaequale]|uniref:non-specific serine/threonine protein kinase n=1 Tax=Parachaetomium inaequale TaxID=2588326 RepID=A0AAN6PDF9_9PEZI|nr:protein kinase dsk1 [Parachaetomium inaequale]
MADGAPHPPEKVYLPDHDIEDIEEYRAGGYHPTVIGDVFHNGRYEVVHKLGSGGYSTTWLARDKDTEHYVALKIPRASEASKSTEADILRLLSDSASGHKGQRFIPRLLDEFAFDGPNGRHICLVQEAGVCSIARSKEDAANFMFPVETARSIAAQLILGFSYLHSRGTFTCETCSSNYGPSLDHLTPDDLHSRYGLCKSPVRRVDGADVAPHAPTYVKITDYGTSVIAAANEPFPKLYTPTLYLPPEAFFHEPATLAADVWTLGVNLYEILGERPLFETFVCDPDDVIWEMINTLGRPPQRWWDKWAARGEVFEDDGSWKTPSLGSNRVYTPAFRRLHQRMWDMGRGETPETCEWDVEGGEMRALEDMLRGMMAFEPKERLTTEDLVKSEYMVKWALPAWERQLSRQGESASECVSGTSD